MTVKVLKALRSQHPEAAKAIGSAALTGAFVGAVAGIVLASGMIALHTEFPAYARPLMFGGALSGGVAGFLLAVQRLKKMYIHVPMKRTTRRG